MILLVLLMIIILLYQIFIVLLMPLHYVSENGKRMTWIDHVLCTASVNNLISHMSTLQDVICFDHRPLYFSLERSVAANDYFTKHPVHSVRSSPNCDIISTTIHCSLHHIRKKRPRDTTCAAFIFSKFVKFIVLESTPSSTSRRHISPPMEMKT